MGNIIVALCEIYSNLYTLRFVKAIYDI